MKKQSSRKLSGDVPYLVLCIGVLFLLGCEKLKEQGSIAGKVSYSEGGNGVSDVKVVALGDSLTPGQSINYNSIRFDPSTDTDGNFKIELVEQGDYFIVAWADSGTEWTYEDSLDAIGFHTGKVSLDKGEDKTGINIDTLYIINP